jgi:hypothetical protein
MNSNESFSVVPCWWLVLLFSSTEVAIWSGEVDLQAWREIGEQRPHLVDELLGLVDVEAAGARLDKCVTCRAVAGDAVVLHGLYVLDMAYGRLDTGEGGVVGRREGPAVHRGDQEPRGEVGALKGRSEVGGGHARCRVGQEGAALVLRDAREGREEMDAEDCTITQNATTR